MIRRPTKRIASRSKNYGKPRPPWHPQRVRVGPVEMAQLRQLAWKRCAGYCENDRPDGSRCMAPINWMNFELHHVIPRGRGGSDELTNLKCLCVSCHRDRHGKLKWSKP